MINTLRPLATDIDVLITMLVVPFFPNLLLFIRQKDYIISRCHHSNTAIPEDRDVT